LPVRSMVGRASLFWLDHLAITGLVPLPNLSSLGLRGPISDRLFSFTRWKGLVMRISGTVKFFNGAKGFGFISPADGSKDVFVHATALERAGIRSLNEGDKVTFVLEDDRKGRGKQAAQIELA
jgi:cold shock protein